MLTLPTQAGESTILWSEDVYQIRIERVVDDGWILHTECAEDDEPYPAGVPSKALRDRIAVSLALALRGHADLAAFQFMDVVAKGSTAVPARTPVKIARSRGWFVEMTSEGGLTDGDLAVCLKFKRPLSATEMLVFLKRLAAWSDARDAEGWP
jgi:hypothetical protein